MQSMQRQFGKLMNKGPGNNAKVAVILTDYEDADKVLAKIIDGGKSWRDAWVALITHQLAVVTEYVGLYDPIVGATDGHGCSDPVPTPELQLSRTFKLREVYADLRNEMMQEIQEIEPRVIKPAVDARDCILPIRKTIKKRENKRLDYEKAQDKVNKLSKKYPRTPKEDSALAKAEQEMTNLADEFQIADDHLRETLPPIITAAFSIIPPLLGCHVLVQNKLLGLYYTVLHTYCDENDFPSPPPPMDQVIADWAADFRPVQKEVEAIPCIARGKAIHQPMKLAEDGQPKRASTAPQPSNGFRRSSSGLIQSNGPGRQLRVPSTTSIPPMSTSPVPSDNSPQPSPRIPPSPGFGAHLRATDFTTASVLGGQPTQSPGIPSSTRPKPGDYFSTRPPAASNNNNSAAATYTPVISSGGSIVAKKKPPPPPPPKRVASARPEEFVVALYTFEGQGRGDLSFREGDRIKIVKRTQTELSGELHQGGVDGLLSRDAKGGFEDGWMDGMYGQMLTTNEGYCIWRRAAQRSSPLQ